MPTSLVLPGDNVQSLAHAAARILSGELVGMPTETVYGLAADACNDFAVAKIFSAKSRPSNHPLIVHIASANVVTHFASQVPAFAESLMHAFWPGPLTLILPRLPGVAMACAGGQDSIGIRCPSHPIALALLKACADQGIHGLAAPSANAFGRVSPTTAAHVEAEFPNDLLILNGGACQVGIESTIIDCTRGAPVLLRPGVLTSAQIEAACGQHLLDQDNPQITLAATPRASGTLASHYAPQARVRLMHASAIQQKLADLPFINAITSGQTKPSMAIWCRTPLQIQDQAIIFRSMPLIASDAAHDLFATLRELDALGVAEIWIEQPPSSAEWDGVRDRLQRAAA